MMSDKEFESRWQHNQEQRQAEAGGVIAKWDQADAKLLAESGWPQQKIADKIKCSQQHVDRMLRFARFLDYTHGCNSPTDPPQASIASNLTERAFRKAWSQASKRRKEH
jgi:hypothetical protein